MKNTCWVSQKVTKKWNKYFSKQNIPSVQELYKSCSRCGYDVIPGYSHGGLSPIMLYRASPLQTRAHISSETTWYEPPLNRGLPSVANPLHPHCQEACEGGEHKCKFILRLAATFLMSITSVSSSLNQGNLFLSQSPDEIYWVLPTLYTHYSLIIWGPVHVSLKGLKASYFIWTEAKHWVSVTARDIEALAKMKG